MHAKADGFIGYRAATRSPRGRVRLPGHLRARRGGHCPWHRFQCPRQVDPDRRSGMSLVRDLWALRAMHSRPPGLLLELHRVQSFRPAIQRQEIRVEVEGWKARGLHVLRPLDFQQVECGEGSVCCQVSWHGCREHGSVCSSRWPRSPFNAQPELTPGKGWLRVPDRRRKYPKHLQVQTRELSGGLRAGRSGTDSGDGGEISRPAPDHCHRHPAEPAAARARAWCHTRPQLERDGRCQ